MELKNTHKGRGYINLANMTAAVYSAPDRIEVREVPVPDLGKGQVLVRVRVLWHLRL